MKRCPECSGIVWPWQKSGCWENGLVHRSCHTAIVRNSPSAKIVRKFIKDSKDGMFSKTVVVKRPHAYKWRGGSDERG